MDAKAGLCLCCLQTLKDRVSCVKAHVLCNLFNGQAIFGRKNLAPFTKKLQYIHDIVINIVAKIIVFLVKAWPPRGQASYLYLTS